MGGFSALAVRKLDALEMLDAIGLCGGYHNGGELVTEFPGDLADLKQITPHSRWDAAGSDYRGVKDD
jgi:adenylosuccinate synthase